MALNARRTKNAKSQIMKSLTWLGNKVGGWAFSIKIGVNFAIGKPGFQLYLAKSYVDPPICHSN